MKKKKGKMDKKQNGQKVEWTKSRKTKCRNNIQKKRRKTQKKRRKMYKKRKISTVYMYTII